MHMLPFKTIAGLIVLALPGAAPAADMHTQVIAATCMACHGPGGKSRSESIASLAGLKQSDFVKTMQEFKSGAREGTIMQRHAEGYTDAEFKAMGAYFESLK